MPKLPATLMLVTTLALGGCTGGGGGTGGTPGTTTPNTGGGDEDQAGTGETGGQTGDVTVPEIFYGGWVYQTATLYEEGKEPTVSSVSGDADFRRDLTYEQSYAIGSIDNAYEGRYTVDGPDPRTEGAFFITTYDEDGNQAFKLSVACGDSQVMALTLYDEEGEPSIVFSLASKNP